MMPRGKQISAIFCVLCLLCRVFSDVSIRKLGERIVRIRAGLIRGVQVDFPNNKNLKSVERFSGLQYASVRGIRGNGLRFMPPSSILPRWGSSPQLHSQFSPVCPQDRRLFNRMYPDGVADKFGKIAEMAKAQDENCLCLNIWAHKPEYTCAGNPSQEDRGLVPPEGVKVTWELNGTRWTIRLGVGLAEPG